MRIYVAGPMTGIENYNFPKFWEVAEELKALGHEVENPADNDGDTLESATRNAGSLGSWESYLRHDLTRLVKCDAIFLLDGFDQSKGATLEAKVAEKLGMMFFAEHRWPESVPPIIVGLCGYAQSGKDTVAETLVDDHSFERIAFADNVRALAEVLNGFVKSRVSEFGWDEAKKNPVIREYLQRVGQGVRDVLGEDSWVDAALRDLKPGRRYVVTDVRYPNELEVIRALGGTTVRIARSGVGPINGHVSETAIDGEGVDYWIQNDSTLTDLAESADALAKWVLSS